MMKKQGRGERRKYGETGFEKWGGYMSAKISKLQDQFKRDAGTNNEGIFTGVAIFVNGYTNPTGEELKRIMMTHGGTYHHYYSRNKTTHIIASNLPNSKINSLNTDFIVSPKWITDSLEANKLLDYTKYLLYTRQKKNQPQISFQKKSDDEDTSLDKQIELKAIDLADNDENSTIVPKNNEVSMLNDVSIPKTNPTLAPSAKSSSLSTANPNFLTEFYNNSRLHHISTTGAMFKQYVRDLQDKEDDFVGREHLKNWMKSKGLNKLDHTSSDSKNSRTIMHIDMDCFFVSVGLINYPELANEPVAVTHATKTSQPKRDKDNFEQEVHHFKRRFNVEKDFSESESQEEQQGAEGTYKSSAKTSLTLIDEKCSMAEIASCSYEARKRGIKNGMFLGVALKLCPELKTIPYDFEGYRRVSMDLYDIVASYTKNIEAVSCDEMYVELDDVLRDCGASPLDFASCIREQIQEKTKCPCSVGIGPNMLTARMATKKAKPNGQFLLESSEVQQFMESQLVSELPGVGRSLRVRLEEEGVTTCGELQSLSLPHLQSTFGNRTGKSLFEFCRGIDARAINKEHKRKSVSAEVNYGIRFTNWQDSEKFLLQLSEEVKNRLDSISMKGRTISLKLKIRAKDAPVETAKFMGHGICDNVVKSVTLSDATSSTDRIYKESLSLLKHISAQPKDLRGIGIQISKLESPTTTSSSIRNYFSNVKNSPLQSHKNEGTSVSIDDISEDSNSCDAFVEGFTAVKHENIASNSSFVQVSDANGDAKEEDISIMCEKPPNRSLNTAKELQRQPHQSHFKNYFMSLSDKDQKSPTKYNESSLKNSFNPAITVPVTKPSSPDSAKILDIEVLNALPPGLKEQVMEEYKAQGFRIPSPDRNQASHSVPGPSRLSSFHPESLVCEPKSVSTLPRTPSPVIYNRETEHPGKEEPSELSFSQIDSSFLNALPEDIREDLEKDFQKQKILKTKRNNRASQLPSAAHLPTGRRKRGRPRGGVNRGPVSKKKVLKRPISVLDDNRNLTAKEESSPEKTTRGTREFEKVSETITDSSAIRENIPDFDHHVQHPNLPSLCGESELASIKNLISMWILNCPSPAEVDVQILTEFCVDLIKYKDLERLDLVLKFLNRKTQLSGSIQWRQSFDGILNYIQTIMTDTYCAPLYFKPSPAHAFSRKQMPLLLDKT